MDLKKDEKCFLMNKILSSNVFNDVIQYFENYYLVVKQSRIEMYEWTEIFSQESFFNVSGNAKITCVKIHNSLMYVMGEGHLTVLNYNINSKIFSILETIKISDSSNRFSESYKFQVCSKGIICYALMNNIRFFPFIQDRLSKKPIIFQTKGLIWEIEIISEKNGITTFGVIYSNQKKRINELTFFQTNWIEVKEIKTISKPAIDDEFLVEKISKIPNFDSRFIVMQGCNITLFQYFHSTPPSIFFLTEISLNNVQCLVSAFCWSKNNLFVSLENNQFVRCENFLLEVDCYTKNPRKSITKTNLKSIPPMNVITPLLDVENDSDSDNENLMIDDDEKNENFVDKFTDEEEIDVLLCCSEMGSGKIYEVSLKDISCVYTIPNLSPIVDFEIDQNKNFIMCTGGTNKDKLCVLRRGIQCGNIFKSDPSSPYTGIIKITSLKSSLEENSFNKFICLSFTNSTRLLRVGENDSIENLDLCVLQKNQTTIGIDCIFNNVFAQVLPSEIIIFKFENENDSFGKVIYKWEFDDPEKTRKINCCCITTEIIILGCSKCLKLLKIEKDKKKNDLALKEIYSKDIKEEITCISQQKYINMFAIGLFNCSVILLDINTLLNRLTINISQYLSDEAIVDSIILEKIQSSIFMLCGARNGTLLVHELFENHLKEIIIKRTIVRKIGFEPVGLSRMNNFPFQVCAISSRVFTVHISNSPSRSVSILPLNITNTSFIIPLFTENNQNTVVTVSKTDSLEIWKLDITSKVIVDKFNLECHRIVFIQSFNIFLVLSKDDNFGYKIYVFSDNEVQKEAIGDFLNKPYAFFAWENENDKKQYFAVGTDSGEFFLFSLEFIKKQTSKQRIFSSTLIAKKSLKEEGIVYCIRRYRSFFLSSCSENLFLLNDKLEVVSQTSVRNFIVSITCAPKNELLDPFCITDQYDSIIFFTVDEFNRLSYLQSDPQSRKSSKVRMIDNKNLLGVDRDGYFFCMQYCKPLEVDKKFYTEPKKVCEYQMDDIPVNIRKFSANSYVVVSISGNIYQFFEIGKDEYSILNLVEKEIEEIFSQIWEKGVDEKIDKKLIPLLLLSNQKERENVVNFHLIKLFSVLDENTKLLIMENIKNKYSHLLLNVNFNLELVKKVFNSVSSKM